MESKRQQKRILMTRFILNDTLVETGEHPGSTVLDFIRYRKRMTGTKIGCREGDCGACTILAGDVENGKLVYRSVTSCLMPLINAAGKHIVTVEGINLDKLSPVQEAMVKANGTQCGFCTPGFIMSLTGFVINHNTGSYEQAIASIDGNICRCTGYKSIERAAAVISESIRSRPAENSTNWLVRNGFLPSYFSGIEKRLQELKKNEFDRPQEGIHVGGGTDLLVQKPLMVKSSLPIPISFDNSLKSISKEGDRITIGGGVTVSEFAESGLIADNFKELPRIIKLISSTPIRNMATMAGNLVNASPIGDMSIFFLALDAELELRAANGSRRIPLKEFYKGYKQKDLQQGEIVSHIRFNSPVNGYFNFEKVSKRTHLDIASVNSACYVETVNNGEISKIFLSAGGVAPFPKFLAETCLFLNGKRPEVDVIRKAIDIINQEIAPISDARGTADYKRLLLRQFFIAHMLKTSGSADAVRKILAE
jgi:xanthine dehydrogenase small subunit